MKNYQMRWNVKDENQNLVELNATEVIDGKEVALTIGFKIDEVGQRRWYHISL